MSRAVRQDPLTGEHVILASVRATPRGRTERPERSSTDCPFCPGNEAATAATIQQVDRDGRWGARAFANRSPGLVVEEPHERHVHGMFHALSGFGAHEVLVESPEHDALHRQPVHRMAAALELARARVSDLQRDERLQALCWFRNHGSLAGASQPHPHAQVMGLPFVPERWQRYVRHSQAHWQHTRHTLLSAVRHDEIEDGSRVVGGHGPVVALCPFASSQPFEVWLLAEEPGPTLASWTDAELDGVAHLTTRCLRAIEAAVGGPVDYTATVLGAPSVGDVEGVGWHLRIVPRLVRYGGLFVGMHAPMHGVFPEHAATALRAALAAAE
ncbi:MAG: hypothetical protein KTR31_07015 [Myxococcales bacterium]|nr:hypothetical protein [Myxococcales bacterium]